MTVDRESIERRNYFDQLLDRSLDCGVAMSAAIVRVAEAYLDGRPQSRGRRMVTRRERDAEFWTCRAVHLCEAEVWRSEEFVLALARYLSQDVVTAHGILEKVAREAPDALIRATRYSGMVLEPHPQRRAELSTAATASPAIAELCWTLEYLKHAQRNRIEYLERSREPLTSLSPFELLIYASLHAFETWVPRDLADAEVAVNEDQETQTAWDAINDLLIWKLSTTPEASLHLTEHDLVASLKAHLAPFLFPSALGPLPRHDLRTAFAELLAAQIELNSFVSRSADAFSYDDGIRFERQGDDLQIVQHNPAAREAWAREGDKLARLHGYWFYRALHEFAASEAALKTIGAPENHDANRLAYIRALRSHLQLTEVYGASDTVTAETGERVDLVQALLSMELMSAFFAIHFLAPFSDHLKGTGSSLQALSLLAFHGLRDGNQNRFPLTWSNRSEKIERIKGWTVSKVHPEGSQRMAAAILDFWTSDWVAMAARLGRREPGLSPDLFERPILKLGQTLLQLPWIVAAQNNSTAAINNLRRLGARRDEAASETRRIEQSLGSLFRSRGYTVLANWHPPVDEAGDAGEVDLICTRDGSVLVLEVKSTYLRRSQRDAFVHATTTLRRAGLQLRQKVAAVRRALMANGQLAESLELDAAQGALDVECWIVDTSIECDHQRFSGFLKISLEELLIALRDDRHLLNDPASVLSGRRPVEGDESVQPALPYQTLYATGFSAGRFREVIENELVWVKPTQSDL